MEQGKGDASWLDSRVAGFIGACAGLATVLAVFALFAVWSNRVPAEDALIAVSGDAVVVEGGYAHLVTTSGPLKITYDCACGRGWQASMRDGKQVDALVTRVNQRRAKAFHVEVDGAVLVDGAQLRARYRRNLALAGSFGLLCVPMLGLRWVQGRRRRRPGSAGRSPFDVLADGSQAWATRREALDALLGTKDSRLIWVLHEVGTRNTEPVAVLEEVGAALARQQARFGEDELAEDELIYLQMPARQAFDAEMKSLTDIPGLLSPAAGTGVGQG